VELSQAHTYKQTLLNSNSNGKLFYKSQSRETKRFEMKWNEEIQNTKTRYPQEIPSSDDGKNMKRSLEKIVYTIHNTQYE